MTPNGVIFLVLSFFPCDGTVHVNSNIDSKTGHSE